MKIKSVSLRPVVYTIFITVSLLLFPKCKAEDPIEGGWKMPQKDTYEYEVGPKGRTIEVKDHSAIHGFTVVIPAGAVSRTTKIYITKYADAPQLPKGLKGSSAIELASDGSFLKEFQIKFPCFDTPDKSGKMLCAFYWDTSTSNWQTTMPEMFGNDLMTVKTKHFGQWRWGEVIPEDVKPENLSSFLDEAYGPKYLERLAEAFDIEAASLIKWNNLNYCANKSAIISILEEIVQKSKTSAEKSLGRVNSICDVWSHSPTVNDVFYGFDELIQIHIGYIAGNIIAMGLDMIPKIGGVLSACATANAEAIYKMKLGKLKNEYICIFSQAESRLWIDIGVFYMAKTVALAMAIAEKEYPCK